MTTSPPSGDEDFIMFPVPKRRVMDVIALLADGEGQRGAGSPTRLSPGPGSKDAERLLEWTKDLVERNWNDSSDAMKVVLRCLADRPGQWTTIVELADAVYGQSDIPHRQKIAGVLGGLGKRAANWYEVTTWPFAYRENCEPGVPGYRMSASIAELHQGLG